MESMGGQKLCVVCVSDDDYKIIIVDVDLADGGGCEVRLDKVPDIRIRGLPYKMSFCIVDSVLYMFGGYSLLDKISIRYGTTCVYKYDFSLIDLDKDLVLEKSDFVECKSMLNPKLNPHAIPTPDGKIVVHPHKILLESMLDEDEDDDESEIDESKIDEDESEIDEDGSEIDEFSFKVYREAQFELFDPAANSMVDLPKLKIRSIGFYFYEIWDLQTDSWKKLPGLPSTRFSFLTIAYSFFKSKHELVVFIYSDYRGRGGTFLTLDIESPTTKGWQLYPGWKLDPDGFNFPSMLVDNRLFFTPYYGLIAGDGDTTAITLGHPRLLAYDYMVPSERRGCFPSLAPIHFDSTLQEYFFCVLSSKCSDVESHLLIDILKYDLLPTTSPQVRRTKYFKICLEGTSRRFYVRTASMIGCDWPKTGGYFVSG